VTDLELTVVTELDGPGAGEIRTLVDSVSADVGRSPLSEHKLMRLARLTDGAPVTAGSSEIATGVVARSAPDGGLAGYAQLAGDRASGAFAVEFVVSPAVDDRSVVTDALAAATVAEVHRLGGGTLRLWVGDAQPSDDVLAQAHGFDIERELLQLRCPLPLPGATSPGATSPGGTAPDGTAPPSAIVTRPFRVGVDEQAWLHVNNRAFAGHPEQGGWTLATLVEREHEAWFDPDGLLLLEEDGVVVGSCWTKVHDHTAPPMGEIYVIGVDPAFHGRGWGRSLTEAGLDWLAGRGLTVGMLYVDADNVPAVTLYRSLGFRQHHVDRAYRRTVAG
jgi:mycothiol synthase